MVRGKTYPGFTLALSDSPTEADSEHWWLARKFVERLTAGEPRQSSSCFSSSRSIVLPFLTGHVLPYLPDNDAGIALELSGSRRGGEVWSWRDGSAS